MAVRVFESVVTMEGAGGDQADLQAVSLLRRAVSGEISVPEAAACLFELEAMHGDGSFLDHAASIAAEAMSNPDPTPALRRWAAMLPDPIVSASSAATEPATALWNAAPSPTITFRPRLVSLA